LCKPDKIDENLPPFITDIFTSIEQSKRNDFDFSFLFQTIVCKKTTVGSALVSENQWLLMDQCFNLHLFDQDLILEKQYQ